MKDKIFVFIIGTLVGAIIATGAFLVYSNTTKCNDCSNTQFKGGEPPEIPSGENGNPPEKPGSEDGNPPSKPEENNTESNSN